MRLGCVAVHALALALVCRLMTGDQSSQGCEAEKLGAIGLHLKLACICQSSNKDFEILAQIFNVVQASHRPALGFGRRT